MNWSDIAKDVGKAAPIIGTILGGPLGGAVGGLVSSALGVEETPDAVASALATDPTAYEKLKEAQINGKVQLQQLLVTARNNELANQLSVYKAESGDRDSARTLAAKQPKDFMRPLLALAIVALTGYIVYMVFGKDSVITNTTAAMTIGTVIGYVISELKAVYGFYFGMTQSASQTNAAITSFAVAPGTVTSSPVPPQLPAPSAPATIINNSTPAPVDNNIYKGGS